MAGTMKLFSSSTSTTNIITIPPLRPSTLFLTNQIKFPNPNNKNACKITSSWNPSFSSNPSSHLPPSTLSITTTKHHWMALMKNPPQELSSKSDFVDYYVKTLARVLGSEKEAQMCIYDVSWETRFGFCCDIDEQTSKELARLPEVLSVKPDLIDSAEKDYSSLNLQLGSLFDSTGGTLRLFPEGSSKYWIVRIDKPSVEVVTKAQMVDFCAHILTKVLANEKDAQMCIYHISWQNNFGFCCELDEECAQQLTGMRGVLSVEPDQNFGSDFKDYGGDGKSQELADAQVVPIKTKRLFVTGLSFYTSEKTLRAAFEGFGELVEVKIIMDKISKRSKGYAFIEYTTEEAAGAALKEMNGKIINGWMIVVDVAKTNPAKSNRVRARPTF